MRIRIHSIWLMSTSMSRYHKWVKVYRAENQSMTRRRIQSKLSLLTRRSSFKKMSLASYSLMRSRRKKTNTLETGLSKLKGQGRLCTLLSILSTIVRRTMMIWTHPSEKCQDRASLRKHHGFSTWFFQQLHSHRATWASHTLLRMDQQAYFTFQQEPYYAAFFITLSKSLEKVESKRSVNFGFLKISSSMDL